MIIPGKDTFRAREALREIREDLTAQLAADTVRRNNVSNSQVAVLRNRQLFGVGVLPTGLTDLQRDPHVLPRAGGAEHRPDCADHAPVPPDDPTHIFLRDSQSIDDDALFLGLSHLNLVW
jgi:hypothetical protein